MLNTSTKCLGMAFILKAMPKLDHIGILFQDVGVEGNRCFDVVSRLLLFTPHSYIGVDAISHLHIVAKKKRQYRFLANYALTQAGVE